MQQKYNYKKLLLAKKILKNNKLITVIKDLYPELTMQNSKFDLKLGNNAVQLLSKDRDKINLVIENEHTLTLIKYTSDTIIEVNDIIEYQKSVDVYTRAIELRNQGIIITEVIRHYIKDEYQMMILSKIQSIRNIFHKDTFASKYPHINLYIDSLEKIYLGIYQTLNNRTINYLEPDFKTKFTAADKKYGLRLKDNYAKIYVTLNDEDISYLYSNIKELNKISIIYSLYQGLVTPKNQNTLFLINLGQLDKEVFDLNRTILISEKEEQLIGKSITEKSNAYKQFVQNYLNKYYNTTCNNIDDTSEIIKCINCSKEQEKLSGTKYITQEEKLIEINNLLEENQVYTISKVLNSSPKKKYKKINKFINQQKRR